MENTRMTKYRTIHCLIVLSALVLPVTTTAHAAQYTVTDLGTLGGTESFGSGLNVSGQVAGASHTTEDANIDAFFDRFIPKVLAPIPRADVTGQRIRERVHAKRRMLFVQAAEKNGPDVALVQTTAAYELD